MGSDDLEKMGSFGCVLVPMMMVVVKRQTESPLMKVG